MKQIKRWQIIATIICLFLGILLHFTYEWLGKNSIIAAFSAVNESTWEHLKLVVYPIALTGLIGRIVIKKDLKNYWFSILIRNIKCYYIYNGFFLYIYRNNRKKFCNIRYWFFFYRNFYSRICNI